MSDVGGITGSGGVNGTFAASPGPLTVTDALAALARHTYTTVTISDTVANIAKNLDKLQAVAAKVTDLSATDTTKKLTITGAQYQKDGAILALWGAGTDQTVALTAAKAAQVSTVDSYVTSVSVADSRVAIQGQLDNLQTAASSGLLKEIVQTGSIGSLSMTAAQLTTHQDVLSKIKNQAYTLAITNASVSDVLTGPSALSTNNKVKSIAIVDTTDAIAADLDQLQRVGLRIKSVAQTDATDHLELTGDQYKRDAALLGKFITSDLLDVIDASAAQARTLGNDQHVVTVNIQDGAKNIARNWSLLQTLGDSLTSVEVSDQENAISLTESQFAASSDLLAKFTDTVDQTYSLAITGVDVNDAKTVADAHNVVSVAVSDTGANVVTAMDDLNDLVTQDKLASITLSNPQTAMTIDVARLQDAQEADTQAVLDKIKGGNYRLAVTGAAAADVADLATNARIVSFAVADTSDNIAASLDDLFKLGGRLKSLDQTDSGVVFDLTQTQHDSRSSVLSKISGGYTANLTDVTAAKAVADAKNLHIGTVTVSDTGRNIIANWKALSSLGVTLDSITKSDAGDLTISADNYLNEHEGLVAKFDSATTFAVTGATVAQADAVAIDDAVTKIDVTDESATIQDKLTTLETLESGGKLHAITNQTPTDALTVAAADLTDAQPVLSLIKGGSYSLNVTGVAVADAKALATANHKIVGMTVDGEAADITANLTDLAGLGKKLTTITQTDEGETLALTGAAFEQNGSTLDKIEGGYLAILSQVSAAKAATFAASDSVSSLSVDDNGMNLSSAWAALSHLGDKLTDVAQTDSSTLQLNLTDWNNGQALRAKFGSATLNVSVSDAGVSDVATLASDTSVQAIQVKDNAAALAASLAALGSEAKVTQLVVSDPTAALALTDADYAASATILAKVKNSDYLVDLSNTTAARAVTLASDAHVASMDVSDSSANLATNFDDLAAAGNLDAISLTDADGTITLTADQILGNDATLNKIDNAFQLAATGATMANLADLANVAEVSSVSISDTADNISTNFKDVIGLGSSLSEILLTDSDPLALSESDWTAGASALGTINGSYAVDVSDTVAGDAATVAGNAHVQSVRVSDAAANIAGNWDALVTLYNAGAGKLSAITLTDQNDLVLTADQQTAGAAMITNLLSGETILTA
jgi:hypothetical protein